MAGIYSVIYHYMYLHSLITSLYSNLHLSMAESAIPVLEDILFLKEVCLLLFPSQISAADGLKYNWKLETAFFYLE